MNAMFSLMSVSTLPDQRSLLEQLETLADLARRAGLYDAEDFVRTFTVCTRAKEGATEPQ